MASKCSLCGSQVTTGSYCSNCGGKVNSAGLDPSAVSVVAIGAGLLLGLGVGYFVIGLVRYMSEPPLSLLFIALVYGLGLAPFFISLLGELANRGRMMNAILLSSAFAITYYFSAFLTMFAMI